MYKIGFDNDKYLKTQSEKIKERIAMFGGKLYLEFGGKLFDDHHASRVLPGFAPDSKIKMLAELKDQAEVIIVVNALDIEKNKVRGDLGITYDLETFRLIDAFRGFGLLVENVVLTRYNATAAIENFKNKLENKGIKVYKHYEIENYPYDVDKIVSEQGFGLNDYVETKRSLAIVTAPGPGSGKMGTCLSQIYHDYKRGVKAGYAKFETFPVWNLAISHPVNVAYESATADLNDINLIDPYHLEAYGITATNYNRDVAVFRVLKAMYEKMVGVCPYKSPTDMGVNMAGDCIIDDEAVREAANNEIIRRYYNALCNQRKGNDCEDEINKIKLLMNQSGISAKQRKCIQVALDKAEETNAPAAAIELCDGRIVTGKTSSLLGASSAVLINALKAIAGIDKDIDIISHQVLEPVQKLKIENLGNHNPRLHTDEVLIALAISAATDETAKKAMDAIKYLKGTELHSSVILSPVDTATFRKLGVNLTCEPAYQSKKLFHG